MPAAFAKAACSAELVPMLADFIVGVRPLDNRWFFGALILGWVGVPLRCRTFLAAAKWSFLATYVLSPFAVKFRNSDSIALAASGIACFLVHYTVSQPGERWTYSWWERALIWLSFLIGFVASYRRLNAPERA
jgi:hypothetical protein